MTPVLGLGAILVENKEGGSPDLPAGTFATKSRPKAKSDGPIAPDPDSGDTAVRLLLLTPLASTPGTVMSYMCGKHQRLKHLPLIQETWVRPLGWEDPLEKEMATHSSILAWRIPWMEEPGGLQSMQRVGHD